MRFSSLTRFLWGKTCDNANNSHAMSRIGFMVSACSIGASPARRFDSGHWMTHRKKCMKPRNKSFRQHQPTGKSPSHRRTGNASARPPARSARMDQRWGSWFLDPHTRHVLTFNGCSLMALSFPSRPRFTQAQAQWVSIIGFMSCRPMRPWFQSYSHRPHKTTLVLIKCGLIQNTLNRFACIFV